MKRVGPSTEPWGTPHVTDWVWDLEPPMETYSVRSDRYDLNQFSAVLLRPIVEWRRSSKMLWSTVSKAAVRSRRMRREGEPASAAIKRSFVTLTRAVSVL